MTFRITASLILLLGLTTACDKTTAEPTITPETGEDSAQVNSRSGAKDAAESSRKPASPEAHEAAVKELFQLLEMETLMSKSIETMLDAQIAGNPKLAPLKPVMMKFMNKHMSWNSLKGEFLKLYLETFTQSEVEDLVVFYKTPTGRKSIRLMPEMMAQGAAIGQKRVQANLPELQSLIATEQARQ